MQGQMWYVTCGAVGPFTEKRIERQLTPLRKKDFFQ